MFTSIADLEKEYASESEATQKLLDALSDESLITAVCEGHRTIGRIAWHIAVTIPEMMSLTGLKFTTLDPKAPLPSTAREIAESYRRVSSELLEAIKRDWTDKTLLEEDNMYGEKWRRGFTLEALIRHEAHHRGQLTVLMRQAGLAVPGAYGPSKEEWADYGAPAPEV